MDDIIVDKHSRKNFASFLNARSERTDVRMRPAISWDPCGSGDEVEWEMLAAGKVKMSGSENKSEEHRRQNIG